MTGVLRGELKLSKCAGRVTSCAAFDNGSWLNSAAHTVPTMCRRLSSDTKNRCPIRGVHLPTLTDPSLRNAPDGKDLSP